MTLIRRREVWEQVLDELRLQIILGELAPGARLVETELAHRFGVSRGPVRTALLSLEQSGLVRSSARRGAHVAHYTAGHIADLFAVRTALEVLAVREAAERGSASLVERLQAHLESIRELRAAGMLVEAVEADLAFHEEICASTGNRVLLLAWMNLADQLAVVMARKDGGCGRAPVAGGSHEDVIEALAARDPDRAESALRLHLGTASEAYQALADAPPTG